MSPLRPRATAVAVVATVLLTGAGCTSSSDGSGPSTPSAAPSDATASPPLATRSRVGVVTGKLPQDRATRVVDEVTGVVDGWLDAAYVGGDYPRTDFRDAFPGFTRGAVARARSDRKLMSNADIGADVSSVAATRRRVSVDLLATRGRVRAATAHVRLVFRTEGGLASKVRVVGRLFLVRDAGGAWQVFGYDMTKGAV